MPCGVYTQYPMHQHTFLHHHIFQKRFFTLLTFTLLMVSLSGCGSPSELPTATPTKTPTPESVAAAAPAPATEIPTPLPPPPATDTPVPAAEPPTAVPQPGNIAPFTGLPVDDPARLQRRPIFICVNNDPVGRSAHWGLSQADLVYEYTVDGFTITRLTAMYQSQDAARVGPVRSARYPNVWLVDSYDGVLACSGGSDAIRYILKNEVGFPYLDADIDDPSNVVYFQNIGSDYRTRLQIGTDGVRRWLADTQNEINWSRPGFEFDQNPPGSEAGGASAITIPYPGGNTVQWQYDANAGGYIRIQGGVQQVDPATGKAIVAQNVILVGAVHQLTDIVEDSLGTKGVNIELWGFGDLRVFRDGKAYEGTWRAESGVPPRWIGPGEVVIKLHPGQSWVQVVQSVQDVSYQ